MEKFFPSSGGVPVGWGGKKNNDDNNLSFLSRQESPAQWVPHFCLSELARNLLHRRLTFKRSLNYNLIVTGKQIGRAHV